MKVICIDNSNPCTPHLIKPHLWISEGGIYTVISETNKIRGLFYSLAESDFGTNSAIYLAKKFIPLSEIEELDDYIENETIVSEFL